MVHFSTAVTILLGAFAMLRQNAKGVVQHIGLAYLLWIVGTIAIQSAAFGRLTNEPLRVIVNNGVTDQNASIALILFAYLFHSAAYIYVAVAWHRVALRPDAVRPNGPQLRLYLWRLVQQGIVLTVMFIPLVLLVIAKPTLAVENVALNLVLGAGMGWVMLRFGLILPAAAVAKQGFGLSDSWRATAPFSLALLPIAFFEMTLWSANDWVAKKAAEFSQEVGFFASVLTWPVPFLVGLSILSYLYAEHSDDTA